MNRRRIELQLRAVLVTYRVEVRRRDAPTMEQFRRSARAMLDQLHEAVLPFPDLAERLSEARREIESDPGPPAADDGSVDAPEGRPRSPGG